MSGDSSDLSDDIVPDEPQHASRERRFAPWHKVRKEFIRTEQWNKFIVRYAQRFLCSKLQEYSDASDWSPDVEVGIPESVAVDRPLNCLVIPGDDLLDIRSLHRDTERMQCYIRYLGFNYRQGSQKSGSRVHIAHNDVTSWKRVHKQSVVVPDSFQAVAKQNSQAYRYVKQLGPFHVVNLDLCDSLFPKASGNIEAYFNGLHAIAAYQMKEMATPWLLFITTEVAPNEADIVQFDKLCNPTKANVRTYRKFAEEISELFSINCVAGEDDPIDYSQLSEKQFVDLFGIAVGKALLSFCSTAGESWKAEMRGSHVYTIHPERHVVMLSLAFQFTPIVKPPRDATGISTLDVPPYSHFDEEALATKLLQSVKNISDVDQILASNSILHKRMLESSADLLASAGFNRESYLRWVSDGEIEHERCEL